MSAYPDLDTRLAGAAAYGFLTAMLNTNEIPEHHREQADAVIARLRASVWPASDAHPLGVTGKPVPAIDAGRDKGGEE